MTNDEVLEEIEETFGLVPTWIKQVPEGGLSALWSMMRDFYIAETQIPNKYKELIGLGVSGATRCQYCVYYHTEAARLWGATDEEINEAALVAKSTMGWSTYLNTRAFDVDRFKKEFDQIAEHVRAQMAVSA
jgi:AhpD family alkylhydroperoxidase